MRQQAKQSRGRSADKSPPRAIRNDLLPTAEELKKRSDRWAAWLPRPASPGPITDEAVTAGTPRGKKTRGNRGSSSGHGRGNRASSSGHGRPSSRNAAQEKAGYQAYKEATAGHGRRARSTGPPPAAAANDAPTADVALAGALGDCEPQPDFPVIISVVQGWALYIQIFTF